MEDYMVLKSEVTKRFVFDDPNLTPEAKCALRQAYRKADATGPTSRTATDRHVYGCLYCNFMGVKKNWLKHLRTRHRGRTRHILEDIVSSPKNSFCLQMCLI